MASTPSGVGEFSLQSTPLSLSSLSREAVMAEAFLSGVLDMNGEIAQSVPLAPHSTLTRQEVKAAVLRKSERNDFNSEISM
jgi:hypothetical protein